MCGEDILDGNYLMFTYLDDAEPVWDHITSRHGTYLEYMNVLITGMTFLILIICVYVTIATNTEATTIDTDILIYLCLCVYSYLLILKSITCEMFSLCF